MYRPWVIHSSPFSALYAAPYVLLGEEKLTNECAATRITGWKHITENCENETALASLLAYPSVWHLVGHVGSASEFNGIIIRDQQHHYIVMFTLGDVRRWNSKDEGMTDEELAKSSAYLYFGTHEKIQADSSSNPHMRSFMEALCCESTREKLLILSMAKAEVAGKQGANR